jgi:hypothetical protein
VVERTLTERELNRSLLARQLLLERADLTIPRAIERVGGLQTQYAPSAYIGLWSRLGSFERDDLTRALHRRAVIQATLMRVTIHMVSKLDYPIIMEAIRGPRREAWLRATRRRDARAMQSAARRIRALLAETGPRRRGDIIRELHLDSATFGGAGLWVDLVRVPPSGTWDQRRADLYGLADDWVPGSAASVGDALEHLVRRYLGGFGPATRKDIAGWTGLPISAIYGVLTRLPVRLFRDEHGEELVDLARAPLPDPDTPAPVRFLPTFDATLLVHARRTQILPERYRSRIFNVRTPQSEATFLVDGRVGGTWRAEGGGVHTDPFEPLARGIRRAVEEEAERLADFVR